jgi:hypothetical protein
MEKYYIPDMGDAFFYIRCKACYSEANKEKDAKTNPVHLSEKKEQVSSRDTTEHK